MKTPIAMAGAAGRMGKTILTLLLNDENAAIAGACDLPDSPHVGKDIGEFLGGEKMGKAIGSDLSLSLKNGPFALIDFTSPRSTTAFAAWASSHKIPMVIGTTGLEKNQIDEIEAFARKIPIVMAPNMSVGVNVLLKLLAQAVELLKEGYDIEVIEAHHRLKKDAPSGTAVKMAQVLAEASRRRYPEDIRFHREGLIGARSDREIGLQTIRGGDIVGEHTAMFCGTGERLELKHIATNRETFATGAIRAAKWVFNQKPGLYDMQDVLGIR